MSLVKGPFKFKWGANTLNNVSIVSGKQIGRAHV